MKLYHWVDAGNCLSALSRMGRGVQRVRGEASGCVNHTNSGYTTVTESSDFVCSFPGYGVTEILAEGKPEDEYTIAI